MSIKRVIPVTLVKKQPLQSKACSIQAACWMAGGVVWVLSGDMSEWIWWSRGMKRNHCSVGGQNTGMGVGFWFLVQGLVQGFVGCSWMSMCFRVFMRVCVNCSGGWASNNPGTGFLLRIGLLVVVAGRVKACPVCKLFSVWSCYLAAWESNWTERHADNDLLICHCNDLQIVHKEGMGRGPHVADIITFHDMP